MIRQEHLLVCAMEGCAEVTHRIAKALRFGMDEYNRDQIQKEYADLVTVMDMAMFHVSTITADQVGAKMSKVEKYLTRARACGTLTD